MDERYKFLTSDEDWILSKRSKRPSPVDRYRCGFVYKLLNAFPDGVWYCIIRCLLREACHLTVRSCILTDIRFARLVKDLLDTEVILTNRGKHATKDGLITVPLRIVPSHSPQNIGDIDNPRTCIVDSKDVAINRNYYVTYNDFVRYSYISEYIHLHREVQIWNLPIWSSRIKEYPQDHHDYTTEAYTLTEGNSIFDESIVYKYTKFAESVSKFHTAYEVRTVDYPGDPDTYRISYYHTIQIGGIKRNQDHYRPVDDVDLLRYLEKYHYTASTHY